MCFFQLSLESNDMPRNFTWFFTGKYVCANFQCNIYGIALGTETLLFLFCSDSMSVC